MQKAFTLSLLLLLCLLSQAQKPQLYALTSEGGANNVGALIKFDANTNALTALYSFGVSTGSNPAGSLLKASNGKLYGLTQFGGTANKGVIFSFDLSSNTYQKLYDFTGTSGAEPTGNLIQASNGKLYGLASKGGTGDKGVIFSFDPSSNNYQKLFDFDGPNGAEPHGSLLQARNGKLYGLTTFGGVANGGILFSFVTSTNTVTKLHDFQDDNSSDFKTLEGITPYGGLVQGADDKLYGLTNQAGSNGGGAVFSYDINAIQLNYLASPDVRWGLSFGTPTIAPNGKLYWLARGGNGYKTAGGIVSYDLATPEDFSTNFVVFLSRDGSNAFIRGTFPQGSLLLASDGLVYGMTTSGGLPFGKGVVFSFDPIKGSNEDYTKLKDFSGPDGATPLYSQFIEVAAAPPANATLISKNATWKYNDKGIDLGTAWRATEYDDASWSNGTGVFGYGDPVTTTLSYGPNSSNKYRSYYFRKSFDVANPSIYTGLTFNIRRDDGAVVYLNGVEVFRTNMPGGIDSYQTFASSSIGGSDETNYFTYNVPTTQLRNGKNVIAVSVHQGDATSSDMSFDLELKGEVSATTNQPPTVSLTSPANAATFTAPATIQFTATASDPDGTISKVEFFEGNNKVGEDLTAPYEYSWSGVQARGYNLKAAATDNSGAITASSPVSVIVNTTPTACPGTGSITREYWANVPGVSISNIPLNTTPTSTSQLSSFETATDAADQYGQRIRGYICPPTTGSYTFYLSGDDDCELYLSTNESPANKQKIAFISNGWTNPKEWTKYPSQKSATISLQAGTKYYVEALHKEGWAGDNFAVGWIIPGSSAIEVIAGSSLAPFVVNQLPTVTVSAPTNGAFFTSPATINITATAIDADGTISKVEFYHAGTKIGEDLTAPFEYAWSNISTGTYSILAIATDNVGASSVSSSVSVTVGPTTSACGSGQSVLREYWANIPGNSVSDIPLNTAPTSVTQITGLELPENFANNYGERIRGYICPPISGVYTFYIYGDDDCEFWLSTSDNPAAKQRIAYITNGWTNQREWTKYASQKSAPITLQAGTKYYIEVLHKEGSGGDNLGAGWIIPGSTLDGITGAYLSPYITGTNLSPSVALFEPANGSTFNAPATFRIRVAAADPDGFISKVEFYNGGTKLGEDITEPYEYTWSDVGIGTYTISAKATDNQGGTNSSQAVTVTVRVAPPPAAILISRNATWKYHDKGTDLGTSWTSLTYDDASWSSGAGALGYDDPVTTSISYGTNASLKHPSYYFRKSFDIANPSAYSALVFNIRRDDGAVVYLNGVEVFRTNMPGGTIGYSTLASSSLGGSDETTYFTYRLPPTQLRNGKNVVAVSVHQGSRSSSDLDFDLELKGETTSQLAAARVNTNTATSKEKVVAEESSSKLSVKALPNPSTTRFTLVLQSSSLEAVDLKVIDANGRIIDVRRKLPSNGTITLGSNYRPGVYFVEVVQGKERRTLKLLKGVN